MSSTEQVCVKIDNMKGIPTGIYKYNIDTHDQGGTIYLQNNNILKTISTEDPNYNAILNLARIKSGESGCNWNKGGGVVENVLADKRNPVAPTRNTLVVLTKNKPQYFIPLERQE